MKKAIFVRIRKDRRKEKEKYLSNIYHTMVNTTIFQWTSKKENALKVEYTKDSILNGEIRDTIDLLEEEYYKTYYIFCTKENED